MQVEVGAMIPHDENAERPAKQLHVWPASLNHEVEKNDPQHEQVDAENTAPPSSQAVNAERLTR